MQKPAPIPVTLGLLLVIAGVVLMALFAFDVGDNDTVSLGWLGLALGVLGLKIP
jgi:hypothetical protein